MSGVDASGRPRAYRRARAIHKRFRCSSTACCGVAGDSHRLAAEIQRQMPTAVYRAVRRDACRSCPTA